MAYASSGLTRMAGGGGYNVWMYASADAIADVNTEGYFNDASTMVNVGDVMFVYDTATPTVNIVTVLSNTAAGIVDVSDGTSISVADAD